MLKSDTQRAGVGAGAGHVAKLGNRMSLMNACAGER